MLVRIFSLMVCCVISMIFSLVKPSDSTEEQELIKKLLFTYSRTQRPIGTIEIKFALNLNQIVSVKARDQIFMLNIFLDHEWIDERLSWGK